MVETLQHPPRMTSEEFVLWAVGQARGVRHELIDGVVYAQAAERSAHALLKGQVYRKLHEAIERSALPCAAYLDGMAMRVDAETTFEPDCMVRCGPPLDGDALFVPDPMIVVEIRSPSTGSYDAGFKLDGYFRVPSVRHYLMIRADRPTMIHHQRGDDGTITTRIVTREPVRLDPPGIALDGWWAAE